MALFRRGRKMWRPLDEESDVTRKIKIFMVLAAFAACAGTAFAQETRTGRYTMHKSDDGFVRLDTETGAMSLCRKSAQAWGCAPMADTGPSSSADVARLQQENTELRAEIKRMEENLGLRGDRNKSASNRPNFKLPTEKEVDGALDYFERMLKKFQDRLKRLERKSETPERRL